MACVSKRTSRLGFSELFFVSLVVMVDYSRLAFTYFNHDAVRVFRYSTRNVFGPLDNNEVGGVGNYFIPAKRPQLIGMLETIGVDMDQTLPFLLRESARPVSTRLYGACPVVAKRLYGVDLFNNKSRAIHGFLHPQALRHGLRKGRLSRPELAGECNDGRRVSLRCNLHYKISRKISHFTCVPDQRFHQAIVPPTSFPLFVPSS